ncbi:hypothetical protein LPJ53_001539 [Coemansia erecta]|uniref:WD40 repeat-like protein n=1 Tax=Coemansia erecta TaxID=147472 RepID=A0A9W7Y5C6_9FUNG|nr:hypothetical protein LPJ53_001539 [Coemansia erecta]
MSIPFVAPASYVRPKENRPHRFAYDFGSVDPGMYTPAPERSTPKRAPKRTIAYTIPLPEDSDSEGEVPGTQDAANSNCASALVHKPHHPQGHVLGVNALALSFQSHYADTGGVLFSGGRDGVVKAWDLNFPLRRRAAREALAAESGRQNDSAVAIDRRGARHGRSPRSALRASRLVHSDWVNDLVVVNGGETVVSASSDQTVRAWAPSRPDERPLTVGSHLDYVKALAYSQHQQVVISGGLDRKIKLWDIAEGRSASGPITALQEFGDASLSSSVYTLSCNAQGSLVVSGSPENVVRIWDTRSGRQVATLSGHTDHIRAVLLSADSELVLSGSSDTTVKLWSMRMRRCLSTFAHHSDSVWSLYSSHPRFQTFYSASRDGLVAKTVGAGVFADEWHTGRRMSLTPVPRAASIDDAAHHSPGAGSQGVVCVAVAKEPEGVVKIVAADDTYIWTATKGATLNRWLDVSIRKPHLGLLTSILKPSSQYSNGVSQTPGQSSEYLAMPNEPEADAMSIPDSPLPPGALLQSGVAGSSVASPVTAQDHSSGSYVTASSRPNLASADSANSSDSGVVPVRLKPDESIRGRHGLHRHKVLDNRRQVLAQDTRGRVSLWDIMLCRRVYVFPESEERSKRSSIYPGVFGKDLDAIHMAISRELESVNSWCHVDTRVGALTVHLDENRVWSAEVHVDEVDGVTSDVIQAMGEHERVNIGQWMLKRLFLSYARSRVKRGPITRKEAISSPMLLSASADSSAALSPNTKRSSTYTENDADTDTDERATTKSSSSAANDGSDDSAHLSRVGHQAPSPPRAMNSPGHHHNPSIDAAPNAIPPSLQQQQQQEGVPKRSEDGESANSSGSAGKFMHRLRSMRVRKQKSTQSSQVNGNGNGSSSAASSGNTTSMTVPTLPPNNRTVSSPDNVSGPAARPDPPPKIAERDEFAEWAGPRYPTDTERTLALLQAQSAPWEQLYSPVICPRLPLPRNVVIQFYQNHLDASEPFAIYRNMVTAVAVPTQDDISMSSFRITDDPLLSFELAMPAWLTDFLLFNRLPPSYQEPSKVSFILSPLPSAALPPFPNPNARLVANRMLRARKLAVYVVDKLALPLMLQPAQNYINAVESCIRTYGQQGKVAAELLNATKDSRYVDIFTAAGETLADREREALADLAFWREVMQSRKASGDNTQPVTPEYVGRPDLYLDLFCKDKKLLPKHTLATIKTHLWKSSGDVQVHYDWAEFVKRRVATAQGLAVKLQQ